MLLRKPLQNKLQRQTKLAESWEARAPDRVSHGDILCKRIEQLLKEEGIKQLCTEAERLHIAKQMTETRENELGPLKQVKGLEYPPL